MRAEKPIRKEKDKAVSPRRRPRGRRLPTILAATVVLLAVVAIAGRLALPFWLERYVNRVLDQSPDYDGQIGTVEVSLWRGAYSIHDVDIVKTLHSVPVPFFEARTIDISLDWQSLLHGVARGKFIMEHPRLNFVHGPTEEKTQTGINQPWLKIIDDLFPFRIDKAEIKNGEIHFNAFHTDPPVDVYLADVQGEATNLTNVENRLDPLMANIAAHGKAMDPRITEDSASPSPGSSEDGGSFEFAMELDPNAHRPTFTLAARLLDLDVTRLNALTQAYGEFDFEAGSSDLVIELTAENGIVKGYAKPLFRNLVVISARDLKTDDPLRIFWEALVGLAQELFQNQPREQFGTRLTIEGDLTDPRTNVMEIIGNILRNAFIRAYLPHYEGSAAVEIEEKETNQVPQWRKNP